ncbi:sensor histidine kinase [Bacillus paranthracis]|uniref:sensor histidine kinase n=1 Tax=Bacillus cereus group TaxID=86661 RepID=UPI000C34D344|nr:MULTISPECIES: HAMP domain-containing sensor histidine kinase [Bacillus cereus group]MBL3844390.1 ATP-binding protein [Bacillus cereus]MDA1590888.1 HAMP domain-containing sensor histidine kinase [Bacillus cereus group sp. TH225LC]MDA1890637.1 HAMP domain-containing sensor histidine kinase [Bacillus cereus group sp. BY11-1LC]MDA2590558.1 HAMP domain-containing sensor histidine kinase [Bacillus cereus group sp. Bc065]MDK7438790.1 HAMP domain-containing sensor histidine kinase [Bacillus paranth
MEGITRILQRFVTTTILISIFVLIFNFVLLGTLVFNETNQQIPPEGLLKKISQNLDKQDNNYHLDENTAKILQHNQAWAMLISEDGHVQWDYHLPSDVPRFYNLVDVAKLSRYYLLQYPVYTWEHKNELIVVGYPKGSHWKYQFTFLSDWLREIPLRLCVLLLFNVGITLLISVVIGTRLIRGIRPLVSGVHNLAREELVQLDSKGIFGDLAQSINSASTKLQKKTDALKARDEARSNWIAGISHDIRTPLSIILGYASEMEDNFDLSEDQRRQAGIIRHQGEKLRSLVSDLNLVSMLEYEMQPLHLKQIRLSVLARQVATDFLNNGLDDRYEIDLKLNVEAVKVIGDEKLLLRAISNLVQNSVNHNTQGCVITLETSLSKDRSQYRFIVKDNGRGIPKEKLTEITELPYSSRRKRTVKEGHGLGIPMVARIVQAHHGRLFISNNGDRGGLTTVIELLAHHDEKLEKSKKCEKTEKQ